jgi:hypothetical protein
MRGKTTPIDEYLEHVGDEQRVALGRLRKLVRARIAENARRGRR